MNFIVTKPLAVHTVCSFAESCPIGPGFLPSSGTAGHAVRSYSATI